jgi:ribosome-binding factor A
VLSRIILEGLRDPRIVPFSITSVRLSPDLKLARVNISPLGGQGDGSSLIAGLDSARGYLRRELGSRAQLRYVPELRFHLDAQIDKAFEVSALIDRISAEREEGS